MISVLMALLISTLPLLATPRPPQPTPPPGMTLPGIIIAVFAAISYGVFKKINNPKN